MTQKNTVKKRMRRKRGDTRIGTLEKKYDIDFDVRSDMKLSTYLEREGFPSLSGALKTIQKRKRRV